VSCTPAAGGDCVEAVLAALAVRSGWRATALARALYFEPSTVRRALARLEVAGLVRRERCQEADRGACPALGGWWSPWSTPRRYWPPTVRAGRGCPPVEFACGPCRGTHPTACRLRQHAGVLAHAVEEAHGDEPAFLAAVEARPHQGFHGRQEGAVVGDGSGCW
jgi:hypothetical protein